VAANPDDTTTSAAASLVNARPAAGGVSSVSNRLGVTDADQTASAASPEETVAFDEDHAPSLEMLVIDDVDRYVMFVMRNGVSRVAPA
jgi:hypothetical protein